MINHYGKTCKAQMFNRGQSSKVFKDVVENNVSVCVIRNSEPYVAIMSHIGYMELVEKAKKYDAIIGSSTKI